MSRLDQVLEFIQKAPKTPKQVAKHLGVTEQTAGRYLRDLLRERTNVSRSVNDRTGTVRYTATGVEQAPKRKASSPKTSKVSVPNISHSEFINQVIDAPKTVGDLANTFKCSAEEIEAFAQAKDDIGIQILESRNGTRHLTIFSSGALSDRVSFKNTIFRREGNSNVWKALTDKYVKSRRWSPVS